MEDCTDIILEDVADQSANYSSSPHGYNNTIELNYREKNPFDRLFELARKNKINPFRYAPSISTLSQTSPLNTPSILLNDSAYTNPNVQDLLGPSPSVPTPSVVSTLTEAENVKPTEDSSTGAKLTSQRSNLVSVICLPGLGSAKLSENNWPESSSVRDSPSVDDESNNFDKTHLVPEPSYDTNGSSQTSNSGNLSASVAQLLSCSEDLVQSLSDNTPLSSKLLSSKELDSSLCNLIKTLPKLAATNVCSIPTTTTTATTISWNLSSLHSKRKHKSVQELLDQIKHTEASLPPKAKPGRKSKRCSTDEIDSEERKNERKKRCLERNRAAAMRCRLKKKQEIDDIKSKVERYEQQNKNLKLIIESLCAEVCRLKGELLRHKDCNCRLTQTLTNDQAASVNPMANVTPKDK